MPPPIKPYLSGEQAAPALPPPPSGCWP